MTNPGSTRTFLFILGLVFHLAIGSMNAGAAPPISAKWKLVAYDNDTRYYVNLERIDRSGPKVTFWGKTEYAEAPPFSAEYELFCPEFEYQEVRSLAIREDDTLRRNFEAGPVRRMDDNPFMIKCFELFCGERHTEFHANGNMSQRGWYYLPRDGSPPVKTGVWTYWHDNGARREELSFRAGVKDGVWRFWTREGQLWKEQQVVNGVPHGMTRTWYPDGRKSSEMTYVSGRLDGTVMSWNREGEVIEEIRYEGGTPVDTR